MTTRLQLGRFELRDLDPRDATWYQQRKAWEETRSLFYPLLIEAGFSHCCDVGANYGMIGMMAAAHGMKWATLDEAAKHPAAVLVV